MAKIKFSTGPIDNQANQLYPEPIYSTVDVSILNNSNSNKAKIKLKLFELNGEKSKISSNEFKVKPNRSKTKTLDVATLDSFEIEVIVKQKGSFRKVKRAVLRNAIGRDELGEFVSRLPLKVTV